MRPFFRDIIPPAMSLTWGGDVAAVCSMSAWNPAPAYGAVILTAFAHFVVSGPVVSSAIPAGQRPSGVREFQFNLLGSDGFAHACNVSLAPSGVITLTPDSAPFTIEAGYWLMSYTI